MEYLPEADSNGSYVNETERNVHVWCSKVRLCSHPPFRNKTTLGLIAGCYTHNNGPPVSVFYKWLYAILDIEEDECQNMALFACSDPRSYKWKLGDIALPPTKPLAKMSANPIASGHYMLFEYNPSVEAFRGIWPTLWSSEFKRRSRSASQTCTPTPSESSSRNTKTRIDVRMRDRRCLITGQAATERSRGGNFTGLEVAHIFPLMGVGNENWTDLVPASSQGLVSTRPVADHPHNAVLLRADIHSLFDDYQFSIWLEQGKPGVIVRFEKSGAPVLEEYKSTIDLNSSSLGITAPPNLELLQSHFRVALLIHVRGVGKRAVAGFKATML